MAPELRDALGSVLAGEPAYPDDLGERALRSGRRVRRVRLAAGASAIVAAVVVAAFAVPAISDRAMVTLEPAGTGGIAPPAPRVPLPPADDASTRKPDSRPSLASVPSVRGPAGAARVYDSLPETPDTTAMRQGCLSYAEKEPAPQVWDEDRYLPRTRRPPFASMRVLLSKSDSAGFSAMFLGRNGELASCRIPTGMTNDPSGVHAHADRLGSVPAGASVQADSLRLQGGPLCTPAYAEQNPVNQCSDGRFVWSWSGILPEQVARMTVTLPRSDRTVDAEVAHGVWMVRAMEKTDYSALTGADLPTIRLYDAAGKLLLTRKLSPGA